MKATTKIVLIAIPIGVLIGMNLEGTPKPQEVEVTAKEYFEDSIAIPQGKCEHERIKEFGL